MILRRSWGRFLRRRRPVLLGTLGGVLGLSLLGVWLWPATYVAQATVAPAGEQYTGPTHRLIARVTSRTALAELAVAAGLTPAAELGLVARLTLPEDPGQRLQATGHALIDPKPGEGRPSKLLITTRAEDPAAACAAADRIALRLIDLDAQLRGAKPAESTEDAPQLPQHRVALTELLQRFPLLTDRTRVKRHHEVAAAIATEEREITALAARLRGYETKAKRLWALAEEEAREAWAAYRVAEAARLAAAKRAKEATPPVAKSPQALAAVDPNALQQLEDELQRLLSKLTERHPDVRRLRRRIEAERRRAPVADPPAKPAEPKTTEPAADPAHPGAIADDPPAAPAPDPQPEPAEDAPVPTRFLHAARSYGDWLDARNQVDDTRTQLAARRGGLQALKVRHEADGVELQKLLEGLPEAERERARLETLIETTQRRRDRRSGDEPEHTPLLPGDAARIVEAHRPSRYLPWALAAALLLAGLLALLADYQDPSVHSESELSALAPVLGVIPHLRGRR